MTVPYGSLQALLRYPPGSLTDNARILKHVVRAEQTLYTVTGAEGETYVSIHRDIGCDVLDEYNGDLKVILKEKPKLREGKLFLVRFERDIN